MTGVVLAFFSAWKIVQLLAFLQTSNFVIGGLSNLMLSLYTTGRAFIVTKWAIIETQLVLAGQYLTAVWAAAKQTRLFAIAMWSLPFLAVVAGVAAIVGAFIYFMQTNEKFRKGAALTTSDLSYMAMSIYNGLIEAISSLNSWIVNTAKIGVEYLINKFINPVIRGINTIINLSNKLTKTSFNTVSEIKVDAAFGNAQKFIADVALNSKIQNTLEKAQAIEGNIDDFYSQAGNDPNSMSNKIKKLIEGFTVSTPDEIVKQDVGNIGNKGNATSDLEAFKLNAGGGQKDVSVNIDGRELARIMLPYLDEEQQRLGGALISVK
jgi:phage-related protein